MKSFTNPGVKTALGTVAGIFLGAILLVAAAAKAVEPGAFLEEIRREGLDFLLPAKTVTLLALGLETGIGVALILGVRRLWLLIPTSFLVGFLIFLTGRNYWLVLRGLRDENSSCGCFGNLINRTPAEAFWQDLFLLTVPLLPAFWGRASRPHRLLTIRIVAALAAALGVALLAWKNPELHLTEVAARIAEDKGGQGFLSAPDYILLIDAKEVGDAKIFHSEAALQFLIETRELPSRLLLDLRSGEVRTEGGSRSFGKFRLGRDGIEFFVNNRAVQMKNAPTEPRP